MKKTIWAFLLLWVSSAFKGLQSNNSEHMEIAKLKMSLMYVQSIKTFRLLFLSLLSMGVCLVFLLSAILLLHISLFLYAPWSMGTKMLVGLSCSVVYLGATLAMFYQIFASDKWLKIFHADTLMNHLHEEAVQRGGTQPVE